MNIVIAPDSFKGSATAYEVAECIEKGIKKVFPNANCTKVPMADGGEGTVQALVDAKNGKIIRKKVTGPLGDKVEALYGIINNNIAVIEMASASGLTHVKLDEVNPSKTTTFGTGELILSAIEEGVNDIIIGIGGSATMDAGVGMLQALGFSFKNSKNREIGFGGGELKNISSFDDSNVDSRIKSLNIKVACDVTNPLYGINGAAYVYGPQKGASKNMVKEIDKNLRYFNNIIRDNFKIDAQKIPGAGAAGGLGAALVCFLGAKIESGAKIVAEANNLEEKIEKADLVITGEGQIDAQTLNNKAAFYVAKLAKEKCPVFGLVGTISEGAEDIYNYGMDCYWSIINKPGQKNELISDTYYMIIQTTENIFRCLQAFNLF